MDIEIIAEVIGNTIIGRLMGLGESNKLFIMISKFNYTFINVRSVLDLWCIYNRVELPF